jgi:hypothetical protein
VRFIDEVSIKQYITESFEGVRCCDDLANLARRGSLGATRSFFMIRAVKFRLITSFDQVFRIFAM